MKMKLKSTLYFDFCFVLTCFFDLIEIVIEIRQVPKRFIYASQIHGSILGLNFAS